MSLLVINSSNRIAQCVVSHSLYSKLFEKVVCADLYPGYFAHQKWFKFREELDQKPYTANLTDIKYEERSDLFNAIKKSTHVVYVTHDFYTLVPSKLTLLPNIAKIVKEVGNVKKFIAVTPVEHNHYGEANSYQVHCKAEEEAQTHHKDLVVVQSDLVFGHHSTVINQLIKRISNGEKIAFSPSKQSVNPIHCDNLAEVVMGLLQNDTKGASYIAKGGKALSWENILKDLEKALGKRANLGSGIVSPYSNNILSEALYNPCYRNLSQFISQYSSPGGQRYSDIGSFNLKLKDFEQEYQEKSLNPDKFTEKSSSAMCALKWMFG